MTDARTASPRIYAIDLARGLAVALMIGAHATDAFLAERWKDGSLWHAVSLLFGYVAPAFTLLGGVTLRLALDRGAMNGAPPASTTRRLARRSLTILLLGYWLQIPVLSARQLLWERRPEDMARLFDANILQVIAVTGLLALLATRLAGSSRRASPALLLLAVAGIIATPYVWSGGIHHDLPLPFRYYLAPHPPATFPLLPYGCYLLLGFVVAPSLLARANGRRRGAMPVIGAAVAAAGLGLDRLLGHHPPHDDFWGSSIQHTIFRLGGVIAMISLCLLPPTGWGRWLAFIGRRSLAIYTLHLMLIYGSPMTMGGRYWLGGMLDRTLAPEGVLVAIVVTIILCGLAAWGWERLRRRSPNLALLGKWIWWGAFWGLFLLLP